MVVQDTLTGALHEVPEGQLYESDLAEPDTVGETVYDGLGSPIGIFKAFSRLFRRRKKRAAAPPPPPPPPPEAGPEMPPPDMPPPEGMGEVYDGFGNPLGLFFPKPPIRLPIPRLPFLPRLNVSVSGPRRTIWSPILKRFVNMVWNPSQRRWVNTGPAPAPVPAAAAAAAVAARPFWRRIPPGWTRGQFPITGTNRLYLRCSAWPGPAGLTPLLPPGAPGMPGMPGAPGRFRRRRRFRRSRR